MLKRAIAAVSTGALMCGCVAAAASGEIIPPKVVAGPTSTTGKPVQIVASGLGTPTSFAFGGGVVFEGDGGPQGPNGPSGPGGVFVIKAGKATLLPGSPPFVGGVAYRNGTLFVSGAFVDAKTHMPNKFQILAWSGWNGKTFKTRRAIYTAPKKFPGFNGLAIGHDNRLYVGVDVSLTQSNDHGPAKAPYQYDILSMNLKGKHLKVYASGMRQPWQIAFAKGSKNPFVTDFGQDSGAKNPPDFVLHVHQGDNYGFPQCNWTKPKAKVCKGFTKPFEMFKPHTDLGGIGIIGHTIYLSQFGMGTAPPAVVMLPLKGGKLKPLVTGFDPSKGQFVIGLGVHNGWVYFGTTTGVVYRVHS